MAISHLAPSESTSFYKLDDRVYVYIVKPVMLKMYLDNAYNVKIAPEEVKRYIEKKLGITDYKAPISEKPYSDKGDSYVQQLEDDAKSALDGIASATRIDNLSFMVQFSDFYDKPTYKAKVDFEQTKPFECKMYITFDGYRFTDYDDFIQQVKKRLGREIATEEIKDDRKPAADEQRRIYDVVEEIPKFSEGKIEQWLSENMVYPSFAKENGIEGRVVVQFVVYEDGTIGNAQVVRGVDSSLDKEALRVVGQMPNWIPGKQNGRAVNCKFTLPIVFRLH